MIHPSPNCAAYQGTPDFKEIDGKLVDRSPGFVDWCVRELSMAVQVQGPEKFVEAVFRGLEIRNVQLAGLSRG